MVHGLSARRKRASFRFALCSTAALLGLAGAASAQEADTFALEEIIVTATRRAENIQDVPYNISVVGGADVARMGMEDISDIARATPGLTLIDAGPRNINATIIRGLSVDALSSPEFANNGTVASYINDTPVLTQPKLIDINRVELLRGPQGTLYGSGSLGGAIRYIVNNPDLDDTRGSAKVRLFQLEESDGLSYEAFGVVNVPIIENKLAARLAVNYLDDNGFVDYPLILTGPQKDVDHEKRLTTRGSVTFVPHERVELTGSFFFDKLDAGGRTAVNPDFTGDDYSLGLRYEEPLKARDRLWALEAKIDLDVVDLVSSSSYVKQQSAGQRDQTDLLLGFEYGYEDYPEFSAFTREETDFEAFVQELRVVSKHDGPIQYVAGAYYTDEDARDISKEFVPGFPAFAGIDRPDELEYFSDDTESNKESALFGELTYNVTDAWQVTGGARWFRLKQDVQGCTALPLIQDSPFPAIDFDCEGGKSTIKDTIFKLNTSYDFTDDVMTYATFSQGFRRGGANKVPGGVFEILPEERSFGADSVDNYELGMRSEWMDRRVQVNAALFYIDWSDIQVFGRTVNGDLPITKNAGKARSKGLELQAQFAATENLTLTGGYAYVDAEIAEDYVNGDDVFEKGTRLPGSPRHALNVAADLEQPAGTWGRLTWHGDVSYSSSITTSGIRSDGDYAKFDGNIITNVSVSLDRDDGWLAKLYVKNLFDEYEYLGQRGATSYGEQGRFYLIPRPRSFGIEIGKSF
ncbi:MAG TPA: TonB-dependent receptor [Azospirillaceae bacterium]|nr:TonB-dependent receptor [Azospirillaceae bacterium]